MRKRIEKTLEIIDCNEVPIDDMIGNLQVKLIRARIGNMNGYIMFIPNKRRNELL